MQSALHLTDARTHRIHGVLSVLCTASCLRPSAEASAGGVAGEPGWTCVLAPAPRACSPVLRGGRTTSPHRPPGHTCRESPGAGLGPAHWGPESSPGRASTSEPGLSPWTTSHTSAGLVLVLSSTTTVCPHDAGHKHRAHKDTDAHPSAHRDPDPSLHGLPATGCLPQSPRGPSSAQRTRPHPTQDMTITPLMATRPPAQPGAPTSQRPRTPAHPTQRGVSLDAGPPCC